jgi:rRNA maturation endonuclease Nob1
MMRDWETGVVESHWLKCVACGHVYPALGDEYHECPECGGNGQVYRPETLQDVFHKREERCR